MPEPHVTVDQSGRRRRPQNTREGWLWHELPGRDSFALCQVGVNKSHLDGVCMAAPWSMLPLLAALTTILLVSLAEWMHGRRIRVAARLAFGPQGAKAWTNVVPWLRVASLTAFAWGVTTLWMLKLEAPDDAAAKERHDAEATRWRSSLICRRACICLMLDWRVRRRGMIG